MINTESPAAVEGASAAPEVPASQAAKKAPAQRKKVVKKTKEE